MANSGQTTQPSSPLPSCVSVKQPVRERHKKDQKRQADG